jgi:hypothetical protein
MGQVGRRSRPCESFKKPAHDVHLRLIAREGRLLQANLRRRQRDAHPARYPTAKPGGWPEWPTRVLKRPAVVVDDVVDDVGRQLRVNTLDVTQGIREKKPCGAVVRVLILFPRDDNQRRLKRADEARELLSQVLAAVLRGGNDDVRPWRAIETRIRRSIRCPALRPVAIDHQA